jgi:hypothetical protein
MKPVRLLLIVVAVSLPGRTHADNLTVCSTSGGADKCSSPTGAATSCPTDGLRVLAALNNSHSGCNFIVEAAFPGPYFRLPLAAVPAAPSKDHRRCYLQPCGAGGNSILGAIIRTGSNIRTLSCTANGSGLGTNVTVNYDRTLSCP